MKDKTESPSNEYGWLALKLILLTIAAGGLVGYHAESILSTAAVMALWGIATSWSYRMGKLSAELDRISRW